MRDLGVPKRDFWGNKVSNALCEFDKLDNALREGTKHFFNSPRGYRILITRDHYFNKAHCGIKLPPLHFGCFFFFGRFLWVFLFSLGVYFFLLPPFTSSVWWTWRPPWRVPGAPAHPACPRSRRLGPSRRSGPPLRRRRRWRTSRTSRPATLQAFSPLIKKIYNKYMDHKWKNNDKYNGVYWNPRNHNVSVFMKFCEENTKKYFS